MKKIFTLLALAFAIPALSQQDPQFSQYMHNKMFMNPAYAGIRHAACFTALYRNQWNGFQGAPNSGNFSADVWLNHFGGAGLNVMYDRLGFETNTSVRAAYSYHQPVGKKSVLAIGVEAGIFSKRLGPTGNDQWIASNNWQIDPSIPPQLKQTKFDLGFGLWFQNEKGWLGISTTHVPAADFTGVSSTAHPLKYHVARHYFITGGYSWKPGNGSDWKIRPSFLVKSDAVITTFDLNTIALFRDRFWFGASYRYNDAIVPMVGVQLQPSAKHPDAGTKIGFAYDYTTSNIKNYSNGSFEFFINYCMPIEWLLDDHGDSRIFDRP